MSAPRVTVRVVLVAVALALATSPAGAADPQRCEAAHRGAERLLKDLGDRLPSFTEYSRLAIELEEASRLTFTVADRAFARPNVTIAIEDRGIVLFKNFKKVLESFGFVGGPVPIWVSRPVKFIDWIVAHPTQSFATAEAGWAEFTRLRDERNAVVEALLKGRRDFYCSFMLSRELALAEIYHGLLDRVCSPFEASGIRDRLRLAISYPPGYVPFWVKEDMAESRTLCARDGHPVSDEAIRSIVAGAVGPAGADPGRGGGGPVPAGVLEQGKLYVFRIAGSGYRQVGSDVRIEGFEIRLFRPDRNVPVGQVIQGYREQANEFLTRSICLAGVPLCPCPPSPYVWDSGPDVTLVGGPYTDFNATWNQHKCEDANLNAYVACYRWRHTRLNTVGKIAEFRQQGGCR